MKIREVIGLLCSALLLLVAATLIDHNNLWSVLGSYTVAWFCSAAAIALLIVTLTAILIGCAPGRIPLFRVITVIIGSSAAVGLGMLVDATSYKIPIDLTASASEWAGFIIILVVLFWIPRTRIKATGTP